MIAESRVPVFLYGEKVLLRPLESSDIDGPYSEWINDQRADMFTEHAQFPHPRESLESYRTNRSGSEECIWLAIVDRQTGLHVGNIELTQIDWVHRKAVYAIVIGDVSVHGKGLGYEASLLLLRHAFGKLNLNRVELGVHEDNLPARRLYKKLGFVEEGRHRSAFLRQGRYSDIVIMGLLAHEFAG
jgi:RimJ/RimL family protein N-acetyltransferase